MAIEKLDPETLRKHKGVSFVGVSTVFFCHDGKGKFLLAKRSKNTRDEQGRWEIGGGGLKWGLRVEDNLRRELKGEYDTEAVSLVFLGYREAFRVLDDGSETHWITLDYAVEVDPKTVVRNEPDQCDAIGWFTLDSQPSPLHSQHEVFMNKYREEVAKILSSDGRG